MLVNLVRNAIEAMQDLSVERRRLAIQSCSEDGLICIRVKDSGPGISPEHLSRLFEPFFTTKRGGMGLGLSISRSIMEAHGGTLSAEPTAGRGTVFTLTLPIPPGGPMS